ncbi:hypothetical protein L6452_15224 [Arctium lappa]|uniref:Uncharacterized protein n=1 Tax=Arctium lappa TaxID=4217 RepID=A0ACB9CN61_ARCLA|nr:hypothetical protein L6452_15224 [Arctium lappa]
MEETSIASVEDSSTSSEESEDESSETSYEDSQREESKSSDLEKPESSSPSKQKNASRHIYFRTPNPSPSATTQSNLPDPEVVVTESEVHTSNPNQQATSENISRTSCPTQGQWLDLQNQGLTCLDRKINSHIHFQSSESEEEDLDENRTLRDDSPEHQGLSGSPSRDNIKTTLNEGFSELEEKLATCVVTNVPLSELLTKSEFQIFCEEVRGSMNEHNFQRIDGSETSALRSENTKLKVEVSTLKTKLLDSSKRIQELEQELFRQKAESSLEIVNLKAQNAALQASSTINILKALQELREEVVATRSSSLSTDQIASISELIKATIQASVPSVSAPSATPQPPPRTSEDLITKKDQIAEITTAALEAIEHIQKTLQDPKGKGIAEPNDDEHSDSQNREIRDKVAHTFKAAPSTQVQEKKPERNTTSSDENRTLQSFTTPVILYASSTPGIPITPVTDATPEKIGALEEEEEQLVDYSTSSEDAFSSLERQPMVMRDAFESESEEEQKDSDREEEAAREQIEVIDVEEYVFKNAQPHHTSTASELKESPEIDGYISEKPSEITQSQPKNKETMVVDEQDPQENLFRRQALVYQPRYSLILQHS